MLLLLLIEMREQFKRRYMFKNRLNVRFCTYCCYRYLLLISSDVMACISPIKRCISTVYMLVQKKTHIFLHHNSATVSYRVTSFSQKCSEINIHN